MVAFFPYCKCVCVCVCFFLGVGGYVCELEKNGCKLKTSDGSC